MRSICPHQRPKRTLTNSRRFARFGPKAGPKTGPKKRKSLILWRARQESNLYQELRKLSFYPLNYGRSARRRHCT